VKKHGFECLIGSSNRLSGDNYNCDAIASYLHT